MQANGSRHWPVRVLSEREDLDRPKLIIPVTLTQAAEDLSNGDAPKSYKTIALIDTGAAISCVSTTLLRAIAADSWDQVNSFGIGGARKCYYHFIDLDMQDNDKVTFAHFPSLKVIDFESHPLDDVGVLIGMDVLGRFSEIRIQGFVLEFGALLR
jgi:hypothetical protein